MSSDQQQPAPRPKFSHELRTPLNHIIGYSETLLEEAEDTGETHFVEPLQAIRRLGKQLLSLVNDIFSAERAQERATNLPIMLSSLIPPATAVTGHVENLLVEAAGNDLLIKDLRKIHSAVERLLELIAHADEYTAPVTSSQPAEVSHTADTKRGRKTRLAKAPAERGYLLVVDDNPENREVLTRQLERQGYYVKAAANGHSAIEMLRTASFDLLLLDIIMPEMDGYEVLRYLKEDKAFSHIPVIMISALDEIESVVRCIEMGAEDYLPKPFDPVLLRARIGASLEKKRLRDKEIQYLEQVSSLTDAASAVEAGTFDSHSLDAVAQRSDALGHLARMFQHMATEVYERERRLKQEVNALRIEIDKVKRDYQVSEITESEYFRMLQEKAHQLRKGQKQAHPDEK